MTTKEENLRRLEALGAIDPKCPGCRVVYESAEGVIPFGPPHKASLGCQSGKHAHCSCEHCF